MDSIPSLIAQYLVHYPTEGETLTRLRQFVAQTPTPDALVSRANFTGHVTASGFVLTEDIASVLLIHHRRLNLYVQPGGHLEPDDLSPLAGARREVGEETGLQNVQHLPIFAEPGVPFDIDSHHIPANTRRGEPEHWHHDFRYVFRCTTPGAVTLALDEVTESRWVPLQDLEAYPTLERVGEKLVRFRRQEQRSS